MTNQINNEAPKWLTGNFNVADAPSPHHLLFEYAKTLSTLSVSVLGLTAIFARQISESLGLPSGSLLLFLIWLSFLLSLIFALISSAQVHKYLLQPYTGYSTETKRRNARRYNIATYSAMASGLLLTIGLASLFILYWASSGRLPNQRIDGIEASQRALHMINELPQYRREGLSIISIAPHADKQELEVTLLSSSQERIYRLVLDGFSGRVMAFYRIR